MAIHHKPSGKDKTLCGLPNKRWSSAVISSTPSRIRGNKVTCRTCCRMLEDDDLP